MATQNITVPSNPGGETFIATYTPVAQLTVGSSLPGLAVTVDGNSCATPCSVTRAPGTQVRVSAPLSIPVSTGSRQDLLGWSNGAAPGDLLLTLGSAPVTVNANYHLMNQLVAAATPANSATFTLQPASADNFYDSQATVTLAAVPNAGFKFVSWSGDLNGVVPNGSLAMSQPHSVQALLSKIPFVGPSAVVNAAGGAAGAGVAPGSIVSIFGANLAQDVVVNSASTLPQTLDNVTVTVGGRLLPLMFVSPSQINAQLPADFTPGKPTLTVSSPGQADAQTTFTIAQDAPGLFQQPVDGQATAVALHADGTAVNAGSPARKGETITVYGTGFGPSNPARPEGLPVPVSPAIVLTDPATVQLNGAATPVKNGFAVAGATGVDAYTFVLGTCASPCQLSVMVNGQQSNTVQLPVQGQ